MYIKQFLLLTIFLNFLNGDNRIVNMPIDLIDEKNYKEKKIAM